MDVSISMQALNFYFIDLSFLFLHASWYDIKSIGRKTDEVYCHIGGENPFDIYKFVDAPDVLLILGQVGCPACPGQTHYRFCNA